MQRILIAVVIALTMLGMAGSSAAQVDAGNYKFNLSGDIFAGYDGSFGQDSASAHGLDFGGTGDLRGYYYHPSFLSFAVQPYMNRSQANSDSQSITDSKGFNSTLDLFKGSRLPGWLSFSRSYDSTGQFGIPGVTGLATDASGQTFTIGWNALFAGLPTVEVTYSRSNEDASILGANGNNQLASSIFNAASNYTVAGFRLHGFYNHLTNTTEFPSFLTADKSEASTDSSAYGLQASHRIPLRGYWSGSASRSTFGGDSGSLAVSASNNSSSDSVSSSVSINPINRLSLSFETRYDDNLFGAVERQIVQEGGVVPTQLSQSDSKALTLGSGSYFTVNRYISFNGFWNRQEQWLPDHLERTINQYGGGVVLNYAQRFLGSLSFAVGANDTATQQGNSGAGMYANVSFSRRLHGWEVGSSFGYNQAVQTLVGLYTTSAYSYGASLKRKLADDLYWTGSFNGSHSGMVQTAGTTARSETASTSMTYRRYSLNGVYSQSGGVSVLTSQGLVNIPTNVPAEIFQNTLLYNAHSFGGGASANIRRFVLSANYSQARSNTAGGQTFSNNTTKLLSARLQYRLRKVYFNAGFTRFDQGISALGGTPTVRNTYFFGFSRWFNVF